MNWIKYNNEDLAVGFFVKTKEGTIYLVGDVNESLGQCNCCSLHEVEYFCTDFVEEIKAIVLKAEELIGM